MPSIEDSALCAGVARALSGVDPRRCLVAVRAVLQEHGLVVQSDSDLRPSWLRIERDGEVLRLRSDAQEPGVSTRVLLEALLGAALARQADAREHERTRERMEMLSAASFEGILIHFEHQAIDVNQPLLEMFGMTREEMLAPGSFERCVVPEDQAMVADRVARRLEGAYVMRVRRKDGSRFLVEVQTKQGRLGDKPVRVVAARDVTEREHTAALLRESEHRLHRLIEATFDYVALSRGGIVIEARGAIEAVLGIQNHEMVGRPILSFIAPEEKLRWGHIIDENRLGVLQTVVVNAEGERIPVEVVAVHTTLDGEPVRLTGVRDMRTARRLEQERQKLLLRVERGERLQSLGVLAGGIAHDFNNLLVGVMGNAELLSSKLADADDRACCEHILAAGERGANLTRQLLTYAGKSEPLARGPVDLAALGRELRNLLTATLSAQAHIELRLEPRCIVLGERATLMQVLMNLLTNASDALADKPGVIEVSMQRVRQPGPEWKESVGIKPDVGEYVLVQVRDDGMGMDDATSARIFEPFFSTKAKGHGLGLAACLGIVAAHGGAIRVESALGAGTGFSLLLPAATDAPAETSSEAPSAEPKPCRVLVVDDEPLVRANIRYTLKPHGFTVFEAPDGETALAMVGEVAADLLIVDFTMPDMDGAEVVRRLRAAGCTTPVVLASGHVERDVLSDLPASAIQGILHKPFGPKLLLAAIERALSL